MALRSIKKGNRETGLSMLRDLLKSPNTIDAEGRGWTWRNIAMALDQDNPEARLAAQLSADSFLEAGKKEEAAKSLFHLANLLMQVDPAEAIKSLDEMMGPLGSKSLLDRHLRAGALHARANRLARLNKHPDAFRDACEAVQLRRGLLGADQEFVSSLHLAALEASHVGDAAAADAFENEAEKLTKELKLPHFQLSQRVGLLADGFDSNEALVLLHDAEAAKNLEIIVAVRVLQATLDKSLSDSARLTILEDTLRQIDTARADIGMTKAVHIAMSQILLRKGQLDRAEICIRKILDADAFDGFAVNGMTNCLWQQEKWGDAVVFLRKQLALKGDLPGLTFALAKSQLEAGDTSGAVTTCTRLLNIVGENHALRQTATDLRERALQMGGTIIAAVLTSIPDAVTREEFERALNDFARFIAAEKRMRFWVYNKNTKRYDWVSGPERRAQDLLHTFLKARFGDHVNIFEEVAAGAGFIDLYIKFENGLALIVELKMCGTTYSSDYAASGEEQIKHYMENRKSFLGYLVVFDSRVDLFGRQLLAPTSGPHTVFEIIIDVRNQVKTVRPKKQRNTR
jgi:tetratricopeptide (TPR) repeat protein